MPAQTLADIAAAVGGTIRGDAGRRLAGFSIDSRTLRAGELFFAIVGANQDGHRFVADAMRRGAAGAVVSDRSALPDGAAGIVVGDTTRALQDLAIGRRRETAARVIGITGSAGKTTTKEMTRRVLEGTFRVMASRGNYNNLYGLPLSLLDLQDHHQLAVLEMGISTRDEMDRLAEIADPDVGVLTNLHGAHLAHFDDVDEYARAKGKLFEAMRPHTTGVFNGDEERSRGIASSFHGYAVTFGKSPKADFSGSEFRSEGLGGTAFVVSHGERRVPVRLRFAGEHHAMNALAAIAVGFMLGCDLEEMAARLEALEPLAMRGRVVNLRQGVRVLDDSYNANPAAVRAALAVISKSEPGQGRRIAVLGDMLELGPDEAALHRDLGRELAASGFHLLYTVGELSLETAEAAREAAFGEVRSFRTAAEAAAVVVEEVRPGDTILVKGSRAIGLDRVVRELREKLGAQAAAGGEEG